ncbi:MAG: HAMP domain-containing histidine kinase [Bacteroidales bacterium]|nr:HAMP domain-containing histidine kinase [Bacteroidales bacterium]
MKKSTIWIIAIVMGGSFLALLFLQTKYFEEVLNMRKEQFDESVSRSLYQAARNLELNETRRGLEAELMTGDADSTAGAEAKQLLAQPVSGQTTHVSIPSNVPKGLFLNNLDENDVDSTVRDTVRQRYLHKRLLLNEVVYSILHRSSDKPLNERIDFRLLDSNLRSELRSNGINIDYHFYITTIDGREVYRCSDFSSEGDAHSYRQVLFPNDPSTQMGLLYIHFPEMRNYIFSSVRFMIPAMLFTLVLLVVFIFTIYTIFRQKRLTEIKNDFINNMTHEFKTPISTISLAAQMLRDPAVGKSEAMFNHISGIIIDETKRLRFQVEKVLQMSMFDRKAATFKPKELDANLIVQDTVNTFRLKVEASGGSINADLGAQNANIFVDEMHFTNVIFNLLDNAVKYKSPDRELKLSVQTRNDHGNLLLSIADNGIGIRRDDLKKIFEKFYRVHTGNRHDVKGFGLGLAYVHSIIKALGGTIHAESEYGKGTKFVIMLPLVEQPSAAHHDQSIHN